jgi:hypothetical protein
MKPLIEFIKSAAGFFFCYALPYTVVGMAIILIYGFLFASK